MDKREYHRLYELAHKKELKEYRRRWHLKNRTRQYENNKKWIKDHREQYLQRRKEYRLRKLAEDPNRERKYKPQKHEYGQRVKREVFSHYGKKCFCCGETNMAFLTIDHINNDGHKLKNPGNKRKYVGLILYLWLRKHGYPNDVRIACFNCNIARQNNEGKVCPHLSKS